MKYNIGDYVEGRGVITEIDTLGKETCYKFEAEFEKSFHSYWLPVEFVDGIKTYSQGLADAWELAKKIVLETECGGISCKKLEDIFDAIYPSDVLESYTAEEALAKIEAYEREKEIKVGDEVKHDIVERADVFVVTSISKGMIRGVDKNGVTHSFTFPNRYIKKTGKHIDIEGLLKQIGE